MKKSYWLNGTVILIIALISNNCLAISWQDELSSASEGLAYRTIATGTESGELSLSSLTAILNGGNTALSANTMANAAGIIEYCAQNKLASITRSGKIQNQLARKLNLNHLDSSNEKDDYTQGQQGLLNTHTGQQLNMSDLSNSALGKKVKVKACNLVLKQGIDYLSR